MLAVAGAITALLALSVATGQVHRPHRSSGNSPVAPHRTSSSLSDHGGFVSRRGQQLTLGGKPYQFEGLNVYNAASNGGCVDRVNIWKALSQIGPGQRVFRIYLFQDWVVTRGHFDWNRFDQVLSAASAYNEKVIVVLGNQWPYCDGPEKYLSWWQVGYRTTVEPGDLVTYRQWVADVVSRYRDSSTIAMWDLVNEGEAQNPDGTCDTGAAVTAISAFADDVGGLVKSLDPNHLVTLGSVNNACGTWGSQYEAVYSSPGIDVCDYHDYDYPYAPMGSPDPNSGLQASIAFCHADGKPIMVSEVGIDWTQITPATRAERATLFRAKITAQLQAGVVGTLMWDYDSLQPPTGPAIYSGLEIGPNDPALTVLGSY
ncbi:MAG TPA: hypothetical protein VNH82_01185 [Candidatus Dormibacteraeota bacterium]|nr:hypothetical protein [Candidatus Dormibacteraeota bacterium]